MKTILVKFWLLRFLQMFLGVGAVLGAIEWFQHGAAGFAYASVAGWAALSAFVAATISAHWAYKRQCKLVFKDPA